MLLKGKDSQLHLCEGYWKVIQLWKNDWASWVRNHPIDGPSFPTSDTDGSVGEKHHSTNKEGNLGPLKKHKGKEVERGRPLTSNFYPSRPKAQKIHAKAAKVNNSIFILVPYTLVNDLQNNPLYLLHSYACLILLLTLHLREGLNISPTISQVCYFNPRVI